MLRYNQLWVVLFAEDVDKSRRRIPQNVGEFPARSGAHPHGHQLMNRFKMAGAPAVRVLIGTEHP